MKYTAALTLVFLALAPGLTYAAILSPGLYRNAAGHSIYVGIESAAPDPAVNQYYDPSGQHTGNLPEYSHLKPQRLIREEARIVDAAGGALGTSIYYTGAAKQATIILIHGADQETREMGFLVPYFVLNGINVISYDQRGTGKSSGNWLQNGPVQRAADVEAVYDAYSTSAHVDVKKMGAWGFSNGGWTAPIVATTRPLAFMILKSAPAANTEDNICYAVEQSLRRKHYDAEAIASATGMWRALIGALSGRQNWDAARELYSAARVKPWFAETYIPFFIPSDSPIPPAPEIADGLRRYLVFDPTETLSKVRTPTLALFGALDRNVDVAHDPALFRSAFARSGMDDFTVRVYKDAGHTLKVSATGFNDDPSQPERLTAGYPQIMIQWLRQRAFLATTQVDSKISRRCASKCPASSPIKLVDMSSALRAPQFHNASYRESSDVSAPKSRYEYCHDGVATQGHKKRLLGERRNRFGVYCKSHGAMSKRRGSGAGGNGTNRNLARAAIGTSARQTIATEVVGYSVDIPEYARKRLSKGN